MHSSDIVSIAFDAYDTTRLCGEALELTGRTIESNFDPTFKSIAVVRNSEVCHSVHAVAIPKEPLVSVPGVCPFADC
jgi:hypothetical protein